VSKKGERMRKEMSKEGRRELIKSVHPHYAKASWKGRRKLLDGFTYVIHIDKATKSPTNALFYMFPTIN
jgi:hypothetical protein